MAEEENNRTLMDLHRPLVGGYGSSIVRPAVQANTFELKPSIIQMIQMQVRFGGTPSEDPNAHLEQFLSICDTFKFNGVTSDVVRLRLFPFSLQGEAIEWLRDLPEGSITTWNGLVEVFMHKYFPPTKVTQLRNAIMSFRQKDGESLNAAWSRFKKMLRVCPVHDLSIDQQVDTFYYGVDSSVRSMLDAAANGSLYRKTPAAALEIISNMAESNVGWQDSRREKKVGFLEMDALTAITAKLDGLTHQVSQLQANKSAPSKKLNQIQGSTEAVEGSVSGVPFIPDSFYDGPPVFESDSVNYVGNQGRQQFNPYSFSYNPGSLPSDIEKNPKGVNAIIVAEQEKKEDAEVEKSEKEEQSAKQQGENSREKEIFKKLHINIPFAEALAQMPSYAKFLKEILSNKRKLVDFETLKLSEECSAILQNKLPPKLKDPGSFSIPCTIGNSFFRKALCDLGASINLMPYYCFEKLGIGEEEVALDQAVDPPAGAHVHAKSSRGTRRIFSSIFDCLDELRTGMARLQHQPTSQSYSTDIHAPPFDRSALDDLAESASASEEE
ncbi:uncharacterized protein [Henckelia pumila]|uniref:uncharacterized protein n=1 Tax=Henckelia pumila TaxID=405737 RepID=UPI003C6DCF6C